MGKTAVSAAELAAPTGAPAAAQAAPVTVPTRPVAVSERVRALSNVSDGLIGAGAVAGEGVVQELRVGFHRFAGELLSRLLLPAGLLGELLDVGATGLGLLLEVTLHELGKLPGALLLVLGRLGGLAVD
jgi:hypothetical protein